jgi:hypothetical protein
MKNPLDQFTDRRRVFSDDEIAALARRYEAGEGSVILSRETGKSNATIIKWLKRAGVKIRDNGATAKRFTPAEWQGWADAYRAGATTTELGARAGLPHHVMNYHLRRLGVEIRDGSESKRLYEVNEQIFGMPSAARDYWFGFFLADGCLTRNKNSGTRVVALSLAVADIAQVEAFRDFIGSTHPVRVESNNRRGSFGESNGTPLARLVIASDALAASLERMGIQERKSMCEVMPDALAGSPDAWRGAVDGDGWVTVRRGDARPMIGLTGSKVLCGQFVELAQSVGLRSAPIRPNVSIFAVQYGGPEAVRLIRELYDRPGPALRRKQITAHAIMSSCWGTGECIRFTRPGRRKKCANSWSGT